MSVGRHQQRTQRLTDLCSTTSAHAALEARRRRIERARTTTQRTRLSHDLGALERPPISTALGSGDRHARSEREETKRRRHGRLTVSGGSTSTHGRDGRPARRRLRGVDDRESSLHVVKGAKEAHMSPDGGTRRPRTELQSTSPEDDGRSHTNKLHTRAPQRASGRTR